MILTDEEKRVIRSALLNAYSMDGSISEEVKISLKMKFKSETPEERQNRYNKNHEEWNKTLKLDRLIIDIQNTLNDRAECTCHACIRVKEYGYIKKDNKWVMR